MTQDVDKAKPRTAVTGNRPGGADLPTSGPVAYLTGFGPMAHHPCTRREISAFFGIYVQSITIPIAQSIAIPVWERAAGHMTGPEEPDAVAEPFCPACRGRSLLVRFCAGLRMIAEPLQAASSNVQAGRAACPGFKGTFWQTFGVTRPVTLAGLQKADIVPDLREDLKYSTKRTPCGRRGHLKCRSALQCMVRQTLLGQTTRDSIKDMPRIDSMFCLSLLARSMAALFPHPVQSSKSSIWKCWIEVDRYEDSSRPVGAGLRLHFEGRLSALREASVMFEALARTRSTGVPPTMIGDGPECSDFAARGWPLGEVSLMKRLSLAVMAVLSEHHRPSRFTRA